MFLITCGLGYGASPLVDRVDTTAFLQVEANSFNTLTPKQQALAYWLSQAAIAIDPIIYTLWTKRARSPLNAAATRRTWW